MNKGDTTYSESVNHYDRTPFLEFFPANYPTRDGLKIMQSQESPRLLKSHLPIHVFPPQALQMGCKFIFVARNPKDTAVSYYHFYQALPGFYGDYKEDFSHYLNLFMNGKVVYGDWFDYTLGWWKYIKENNCLCLKYEDMKKSPRDATVKIAEYLNFDLSDDVIDKITEHCSFARMKKSKVMNFKEGGENPSIRKGATGDWKNYFTVAEDEAFDEVYYERMNDSGLSFDWE